MEPLVVMLAELGCSVDDIAVLALATEGLEPDRDRVLAVGMAPLAGTVNPAMVYVQGGDAITTAAFTGINPETHAREGLTPALACQRVLDLLGSRRLVVGHNLEKFGRPFLDKLAPEILAGREVLDTMWLSRYLLRDKPAPTPVAVANLGDLGQALYGLPYDRRRPWSLDALCPFEPPGTGLSRVEKNVIRTKALFIYLLGVPFPMREPGHRR